MKLSEFFFNTPLYTSNFIEDEKQFFLEQMKESFEGFNPYQKSDSTFRIRSFETNTLETRYIFDRINDFIQNGNFAIIVIECKRYSHLFRFYISWCPKTKILIKIGQYPSVADFHTSQVKQYAKLLKKEDMQEFTKAIGLAAHGVGIGSFVYLRRIFENLIQDAYEEALAAHTIVEADFQTAHMDEKIQLLKDFLPAFLVEHKTLYSILSLGIPQLG